MTRIKTFALALLLLCAPVQFSYAQGVIETQVEAIASPPVKLNSATFVGKNMMTFDAKNFSDVGSGYLNEIYKKPGAESDYYNPLSICYTWGTNLSIKTDFEVGSIAPDAATSAVIRVTGNLALSTRGGTDKTFDFGSMSVDLKEGVLPGSFTSKEALPKMMINAPLSVDFEISFDEGKSWKLIKNSVNQLFVTAGAPTGSELTDWRLATITAICHGLTSEQSIVDKLWKNWIGKSELVRFDSEAPDLPVSQLWKLADTPLPPGRKIAGQCIAISSLFDKVVKLSGVSGQGNVTFIFPGIGQTAYERDQGNEHRDDAMRGCKEGESDHTTSEHSEVSGVERLGYLDRSMVANKWEACYKYRPDSNSAYTYYAPGGPSDVAFLTPEEVMRVARSANFWGYMYKEARVNKDGQTVIEIVVAACAEPGPYPVPLK